MSVERQSRGRVRVERGIYRQPNGKYAVCFMAEGRARFRTVGHDLDAAWIERANFIDAMSRGISLAAPELRFARVSGWWIARYERRVGAGERRERTLENHRYHLERHLLPALGARLMRSIRVGDVAELITDLRARGRSEKTVAGALATLQSVVRFAIETAGSPRARSRGSRPASVRVRSDAASGYSVARRSRACLRRARRATGP